MANQMIIDGIPLDDFWERLRQIIAIEVAKNKPDAAPETELITAKEVAKILGISLPTIREHTINGKLKGYRIGRRVRYKRAEVATALQSIKTR